MCAASPLAQSFSSAELSPRSPLSSRHSRPVTLVPLSSHSRPTLVPQARQKIAEQVRQEKIQERKEKRDQYKAQNTIGLGDEIVAQPGQEEEEEAEEANSRTH